MSVWLPWKGPRPQQNWLPTDGLTRLLPWLHLQSICGKAVLDGLSFHKVICHLFSSAVTPTVTHMKLHNILPKSYAEFNECAMPASCACVSGQSFVHTCMCCVEACRLMSSHTTLFKLVPGSSTIILGDTVKHNILGCSHSVSWRSNPIILKDTECVILNFEEMYSKRNVVGNMQTLKTFALWFYCALLQRVSNVSHIIVCIWCCWTVRNRTIWTSFK